MRPWIRASIVATALAASAVAHAGGSEVVARTGSRTITAEELEARLKGLMPWQLRGFGKNADEVKRAYVDRVLVRDAVLAQGAEAENLLARPDVQDRIRALLRGALLARVRAEALEVAVSDAEVRAYYDANKAKFSAPAKIAIWRILVDTKEEAQAILDEIKKTKDTKRWDVLAREKSLDKATHMRGGNLGFVAPDGSTGEPGVGVDPSLFEAASKVADAELVGEPVAEEGKWAAVWRRQSARPVERTLEQETTKIRELLAFNRVDGKAKELVAELRKKDLTGFRPELAERIEVGPASEVQPSKRPGGLPTARRLVQPAPGAPQPARGQDGLR